MFLGSRLRRKHAVYCTELKLVGNKRECAAKVSSQLHLAAIKRKGDGRQVSPILPDPPSSPVALFPLVFITIRPTFHVQHCVLIID